MILLSDSDVESYVEPNESPASEMFCVGDNVLIGRVEDTQIKYFIGEITTLNESHYEILHLQASRIKQGLRFVKSPKNKLEDVSKHLVLKQIELIETQDNVFLLFDVSDEVYFKNSQ